MTTAAPAAKNVNILGLARTEYKGAPSTLCAGCGHNSIADKIIDATYELGLKQHEVIKLSGIGCSSKSPAYFLGRSHGINTLHGRMPSVATGALTANHQLLGIGVSGDGDTGSIGFGQFKHMVRRNVRMVYVVENNGVYGLTKGQFSATADVGQELKHAGRNELPPLDLCLEAIIADCGFVARSFAGDPRHVTALLKAAFNFPGTAVLDIISPCVTFNDKDESTKSYAWGKNHDERINDFTFVMQQDEIMVEYEEGETKTVELHDGTQIMLKKLDGKHDPTDRSAAITLLDEARRNQQFITGLIYLNPERASLADAANLVDVPLAWLPETQTRPSRESLDKIMASLK
ncbi:MAG TPA: 2-oxoacid:ferredoxin oxidoreductase subunit beta [Anaerolineales bacterium]|nr:2-oxoacid:ferredoxin oxidoreductase subunit beta [Anaerolineales bacterium]